MTDQTMPEESRLLALPPELRNRIYRFLFPHQAHLRINEYGYDRPTVLSICRQVRSEALAIFYSESCRWFCVDDTDYSSEIQRKFLATLPVMEKGTASKPMRLWWSNSTRWQPHWDNLLVWLERYHLDEVYRLDSPKALASYSKRLGTKLDHDVVVVAGMFSTVRRLKHLPWKSVKEIVLAQRVVLQHFDARWGEER